MNYEKEILEALKAFEKKTNKYIELEKENKRLNDLLEEWARAYTRLDLKTLNGLLQEWAEANEHLAQKNTYLWLRTWLEDVARYGT